MFNPGLSVVVAVSTGLQNVVKPDEVTFDVGIRFTTMEGLYSSNKRMMISRFAIES